MVLLPFLEHTNKKTSKHLFAGPTDGWENHCYPVLVGSCRVLTCGVGRCPAVCKAGREGVWVTALLERKRSGSMSLT